MDIAIVQFAFDYLVKKGYTPVLPPYMLRRAPYEGVVDLGDFESMMYKVEGEDLYLIATSEHPIGAMYQGEIIDEDLLPMKFAGYSTCFRKEIGAHGVDTKGLFRIHQFNKIEQFIFCRPEDSWKFHEELLSNAEALFQQLNIPYRVVNVCTGDIGTIAAKKYDIEAWFPRTKSYGEVVSCSNCTDYQARRLNVRCGKVGGEKRFLHTLNSTAIATSRALRAIFENYQRADGSLEVPPVLREYMGGLERIEPGATSKGKK
jgi:seryl-tRNA synthetase